MSGEGNPAGSGKRRIIALVLPRFGFGLLAVGAFIFLPAGSLAFWNGWIFLGTFTVLMSLEIAWLIAHDPSLLEKRMSVKEREKPQRRAIALSLLVIMPLFVLPGLDWRFGWSHVPAWLVLVATLVMIAGYALFVLVMRANSWASRTVELQEGQRVIDSGPYALVRHPMYLSIMLIYACVPLVLGSWWAAIPVPFLAPVLAGRIRNEEALLRRELPGYDEYTKKVRWRMVPGIY